MKPFNEMKQDDFKSLGRSLQYSMSLGDIMLLSNKLANMSDEEVQGIIDKMEKKFLPSDCQPSHNRSLVKMSSMFVF